MKVGRVAAAAAASAPSSVCNDAATAGTAVYVKAAATGSGTGADWTNAAGKPTSPVRNKVYCFADGSYGAMAPTYPAVLSTTLITFKKATVADHGTSTGWSDALGDGVADFSQWDIVNSTPSYVTINGYSELASGNYGFTVTYDGSNSVGFTLRDAISNVTISYASCIGPASGGPDYWCVNGGFFGSDNPKTDITYSHVKATGGSTCFRIRNTTRFIGEYLDCSDYDTSAAGDHANALYTEWCLSCTLRYSYFHNIATEGLLITCPGASCVLPGDNSSWDIYGNIFANAKALSNGRAIETHQAFTSNPGPINLYNNSFYNFTEQACLALAGGVSSGSVAYNNLFYNCTSGGGTGISAYPTHDYTWTRGSGTVTEANVQNGSGDPFVNSASADFHLSAQTTAGFTLSSPFNVDRDGVTRGSIGTWDRGAYEK